MTITKYKVLFFLILLIHILSCNKSTEIKSNQVSYVVANPPTHVIVVMMENHGYSEILNNASAPYINSLANNGILFTNFHGVTHPSQPNYVALFSGSTQGITDDVCVVNKFDAPNLYGKLNAIGKTCAWYSEDLPNTGSTINREGLYVRKHNPSSDFKSVPDSVNKMFSELRLDNLENLVFITPNLNHDMHNGTVKEGDDWLKTNCGQLADWCKSNNGLFIITFDEDEGTDENGIPVIFYGANVSAKTVDTKYDHYNLTKTICAIFGAPRNWTDSLRNRETIKF
jgi:hypothetical protein